MLKPTIFREYDIRGIAETELTDAGVEELGRAVGSFVRRRKGPRINVGRDCRLSSGRLRDALVRGLMRAGCAVTDLGIVPTPLVYYSSFKLRADGAVMITGSHNGPEYNGFKIMCGESTIYGPQIQELRRTIERNDLDSGEGSAQAYDIVTPYVEEVAAQFSWERPVKVVLDAGNGVAGPVLERLMARLSCQVVPMYFEMDGRFPHHHPDPTLPESLEPLIAAVRTHGAELGIGFDGDADRLGAVDDQGNVVWGDQLLLIYAREVLTRKPGATFIGEVKCSQVMYDEIARLGGKAIMWRTGHSLIKAKMRETRAEMAGEMSGHMFFADRYYGFDDAIYAACRLIEIVSRSGRPLSAQLDGLPTRVVTPEIRVDCPDEQKFEVVRRVTESFRASHRVVDVDGVRVLFEDGWGLLRASNTGPVLVMRFEAASQELLDRYREEMERALSRARAA